MSPDEIASAIPNGANAWDFAKDTGVGLTWAFGQYAYVYRSDLVDPPITDFKQFWDKKFDGMRGITYQILQCIFPCFMSSIWKRCI